MQKKFDGCNSPGGYKINMIDWWHLNIISPSLLSCIATSALTINIWHWQLQFILFMFKQITQPIRFSVCKDFVGKMHPWSQECLNSEKNVSLLLAKSSLSTILTSSLGLLSPITFTFHLFDLSWEQSVPNGKWNKTLCEWFQRLRRHI